MQSQYSMQQKKIQYTLLVICVAVLLCLTGLKLFGHLGDKQSIVRHKSTSPVALASAKQGKPVTPNYSKPAISRIGQARFFVLRDESLRNKRYVKAYLKATDKHTDIWVDRAQPVPQAAVSSLLERIETRIYPQNLKYLANEDCRRQVKRLSVLITDTGISDGYFDSSDLEGRRPLNLIYLNSRVIREEPVEAYNTVAHEFAHLLFYCGGGADIEWLDEGMAVYAEYLNGNYPGLYIDSFKAEPYTRLTADFSNNNNSYGAAFLFVAFAASQVEKSGNSVPQFMQELILNSNGGMAGINATLREFISNPRFDSFQEIYQLRQLRNYNIKPTSGI